MITEETVRTIVHALSVSRFDHYSYDAKACAQRNLSGKTHYADDSTLKFFHARINSARPECEGLILLIVESVADDPDNRTRSHRFAAFDLFGQVINDRAEMGAGWKSTEKARAAAAEWLAGFDPVTYYAGQMREKAERLTRQAVVMREAARNIETKGA